MTDPAFYKSCDHIPDSEYYLYSLKGYQPCYFLDFTKSYEVKFRLVCQVLNEQGFSDISTQNLGYTYRDVIEKENSVQSDFQYIATNADTKFNILKPESFKVSI